MERFWRSWLFGIFFRSAGDSRQSTFSRSRLSGEPSRRSDGTVSVDAPATVRIAAQSLVSRFSEVPNTQGDLFFLRERLRKRGD
jgi:hypothetical protein